MVHSAFLRRSLVRGWGRYGFPLVVPPSFSLEFCESLSKNYIVNVLDFSESDSALAFLWPVPPELLVFLYKGKTLASPASYTHTLTPMNTLADDDSGVVLFSPY